MGSRPRLQSGCMLKVAERDVGLPPYSYREVTCNKTHQHSLLTLRGILCRDARPVNQSTSHAPSHACHLTSTRLLAKWSFYETLPTIRIT
jgi:hypothetical protein